MGQREVPGRKVALHAIRNKADCVWGFDTSSLGTFDEVHRHGIQCVLEQTIAHPRLWNRILTEERERLGDGFDPDRVLYLSGISQEWTWKFKWRHQIVCGSAFVKETMIQAGVRPQKLNVIPYGVDTDVVLYSRPGRFPRQPAPPLRRTFWSAQGSSAPSGGFETVAPPTRALSPDRGQADGVK